MAEKEQNKDSIKQTPEIKDNLETEEKSVGDKGIDTGDNLPKFQGHMDLTDVGEPIENMEKIEKEEKMTVTEKEDKGIFEVKVEEKQPEEIDIITGKNLNEGGVKEVRSDIDSLKRQLNDINIEKEKFYNEKKEVSKKIVSLIQKIKESKKTRDEKTSTVGEDKKKRLELNKEIKENIEKIKELNKQKVEIQGKNNITSNPIKIKKEIEALEMKIETEPMSFNNEKKLMKRLNSLKKEYKGVAVVSDVLKDISILSKKIDDLKKKANSIHKQIQIKANASQESHEDMLSISKRIDELRIKEKELNDKFLEKKKEYNEINSILKGKLNIINEHADVLKEKKKKSQEKQKKEKEKELNKKSVEVEEKIKKKEKLTTEDLLMWQAKKDKN